MYKDTRAVYGIKMGEELIRRGFTPTKIRRRNDRESYDLIYYFPESRELRYVLKVLTQK